MAGKKKTRKTDDTPKDEAPKVAEPSKLKPGRRYGARLNGADEVLSVAQVSGTQALPAGFVPITAPDAAKVTAEMTRMGKPRWKVDRKTSRVIPV